MNSSTENPTRNANARAILFAFDLLSCLPVSPPLSMKYMAADRLPKIAKNPKIAIYVMSEIIA
jgi:hypothetical protein